MPSRLPPFEPDPSRAATLPAFAYTDRGIYDAEQRLIFGRTWQPVGRADEVKEKGAFFTCEVAGAPVVVVRGSDDQLRAFYNVCRHRAGPVASGKGTKKLLACAYHGWSYGLDGRLIGTPEFDGVQNFDRSCHGLRPVHVEIWGPFVFVNLSPETPEALGSILAEVTRACAPYALETMITVERRDYVVACNWKTYVDNYLEGYHLPIVHPGLFRELDYDRYEVKPSRLHSEQLAPIRPVRPGAAPRQYEQTPEGDAQALYYWAFPNWMLNVYPDNVSINIVVPQGPDKTLTIFEWFCPPGAPPIERMIAFSDTIQQEDILICEAVQKGLASGAYESGRFSPRRENGVHHFQSLVHQYLTVSERTDRS